jgi:hypothetical protein
MNLYKMQEIIGILERLFIHALYSIQPFYNRILLAAKSILDLVDFERSKKTETYRICFNRKFIKL